MAAHDPALAKEMAAAGVEAKKAMDEVVSKYAP
jgi:hypothetical protein